MPKSRVRVEEFEHAYLVRGTCDYNVAKKALWRHLGKKKWSRIYHMPARPLHTSEFEEPGESAVALYFSMFPGGPEDYRP